MTAAASEVLSSVYSGAIRSLVAVLANTSTPAITATNATIMVMRCELLKPAVAVLKRVLMSSNIR